MPFSQFVFSVLTSFQYVHNVNKVFLNWSRQRFKKVKRDCNRTRTHNHLIRKWTLNYLAKLAIHWELHKNIQSNKKGFLVSGISSDNLLISFYVSLFIFEEIFCRITWVTFRLIVVLFSFCFSSHKTNYVCKECKKKLKKNCWLNNVRLQLISRLDLCAFKKELNSLNLTKLVHKT